MIADSLDQSISDKAVNGTAPATPGMFKSYGKGVSQNTFSPMVALVILPYKLNTLVGDSNKNSMNSDAAYNGTDCSGPC